MAAGAEARLLLRRGGVLLALPAPSAAEAATAAARQLLTSIATDIEFECLVLYGDVPQ